MHTKGEPRFQVQSAVKIAAIDQPADVSDALLLDVSGTGLKIIADVWWPMDTRIVVEMENHVVVAVVRNVNPRGPKFSLGAEKLYSVLKHTLSTGVPREEWHKLLIADIGQHEETPSLPPALMHEPAVLRGSSVSHNGNGAYYEAAASTNSTPQETDMAPETVEPQIHASQNSRTSENIPEPVAMETRTEETANAPAESPDVTPNPEVDAPEEAKQAYIQTLHESPSEADVETAPERLVETATESTEETVSEETSVASQAFAPHLGHLKAGHVKDGLAQTARVEQTPASLPMFTPQQTYTGQEILPQLSLGLDTMPYQDLSDDETSEELDGDIAERSMTREAIESEDTVHADAVPATEADSVPTEFTSPEISEQSEIVEAHDEERSVAADGRVNSEQEEGVFSMEAPEDPQQTNAPTSTQEDAPPMAALLPKLPSAVDSGRYLTSSKIGPQFGPAYGMAPTADVLTPISTMPAAQPEPEEKSSPKWMASSGLAAALLVVAGLAFYYGPFRPTATSATRATSAAANAASSMQTSQTTTTPPVTEPKPVATPVTPATPSTASAPAKSGVKPSAPAATTQTAAVSKTPTPSPAPKAAPQAATPQVVAKATPPPLPTPQPTPVPTTPARTAVPPRAATSGLRHVVLTASSLNWVAVCSDTKAQFSKVLQKGDTIEIDFKRTAVFHIGTAGASRVDVDGKSIGPVGAPGEVKVLEIGEAGAQTLAPGITANARCAQLQAAAKR